MVEAASSSGAAATTLADEKKNQGLWVSSVLDEENDKSMEDKGYLTIGVWWSGLIEPVPMPCAGEQFNSRCTSTMVSVFHHRSSSQRYSNTMEFNYIIFLP